MMIYKRIVSTKRHTIGYMITGVGQVTRKEAVRLTKAGKIKGVRVAKGSQGEYITSSTSRNLYSLPTVLNVTTPTTKASRSRTSTAKRATSQRTASRTVVQAATKRTASPAARRTASA